MAKVGVVTDSTNCIPPEIIKEYDIKVAPYQITMDGKSYRDQIEITPAEFWQRFSSLKEIPTTGVPSPADLVDIFTELSESTDSIAFVHISSTISAINQTKTSALDMIKEKHPNLKIESVDTRNAGGGLGCPTPNPIQLCR